MVGWTVYMGWISIMVTLRRRVAQGLPFEPRYTAIITWLEFLGYFLYTLSTWGNPVIYTMVNRRFRMYVETRRSRLVGSLSQMQNASYFNRIRYSVAETKKSLTRGSVTLETVSETAVDGVDTAL